MHGRIAITTTTFAVSDAGPVRLLEDRGLKVVRNPYGRKLEPRETVELCCGCVGIVAGTERYDEQVLSELDALKVISRVGAGVDAIDLEACVTRGIQVRNTPFGPTRAVAELTLALLLDLLRGVSRADREMRAGVWEKRTGALLEGKRVGIIGLGRIGKTVADLLISMGCVVAYTDVTAADVTTPYERMTLEDMLAWADVVTLHCTSYPEDRYLLGRGEIALMRDGAWLVNTARGGLVDEAALDEALEDGRLSGAALDVYATEPYEGRLLASQNVVHTPHIGSYAVECRTGMEYQAVENLLDVLEDRDAG